MRDASFAFRYGRGASVDVSAGGTGSVDTSVSLGGFTSLIEHRDMNGSRLHEIQRLAAAARRQRLNALRLQKPAHRLMPALLLTGEQDRQPVGVAKIVRMRLNHDHWPHHVRRRTNNKRCAEAGASLGKASSAISLVCYIACGRQTMQLLMGRRR